METYYEVSWRTKRSYTSDSTDYSLKMNAVNLVNSLKKRPDVWKTSIRAYKVVKTPLKA